MQGKKLKRSLKKSNRGTILFAAFLIIPSVIIVIVFSYVMTANSLLYSFFDYNFANPPGKFVGLANYITTFKSELFWLDLKNTVIMWGLGILLGFFTPIIQALLLNEIKGKKRSILRYLYVLPAAIPAVAGLAIWRYIWNPDSGLANVIVGWFGVPPQTWLTDEKLVKFCICFPGILGGGFSLLIYLITIEGISPELYEAASIDGANRFQQMIHITLPNMAYMIKIQFLLSLSTSLLAFDNVYIMTDGSGGTNLSAETVVFRIYNKAYSENSFGQAMAIAVILLVMTLILLGIRKLATRNEDRA